MEPQGTGWVAAGPPSGIGHWEGAAPRLPAGSPASCPPGQGSSAMSCQVSSGSELSLLRAEMFVPIPSGVESLLCSHLVALTLVRRAVVTGLSDVIPIYYLIY